MQNMYKNKWNAVTLTVTERTKKFNCLNLVLTFQFKQVSKNPTTYFFSVICMTFDIQNTTTAIHTVTQRTRLSFSAKKKVWVTVLRRLYFQVIGGLQHSLFGCFCFKGALIFVAIDRSVKCNHFVGCSLQSSQVSYKKVCQFSFQSMKFVETINLSWGNDFFSLT